MPYVPRNKLYYNDASQINYLPLDAITWIGNPGTVKVALDELADRVYEIEINGSPIGNADAASITYTPSSDSLSCWQGSSDPGSVADAIDQVVLRICDLEQYFSSNSVLFSSIETGVNTTAIMTVGSGSSLTFSGSGFVNANRYNSNSIIAISDGGTGQSTANEALNALLPSQLSNANKVLQTDGANTSWFALPSTIGWNNVTSTPTTLSGYGITDAQPLDADLTAISALSTTGLLRRTGANTWSLDTNLYLTNNQNISFTGDVSGFGNTSVSMTISNNVVTLAKFQTISTASILGRNTGGTGNIEILSASTTKTLLSLNNVENTAISTWGGSTNIITLGNITTGTWNGDVISNNKITPNLVGKTYDGLTFSSNLFGFSISGGTNSKTLTVSNSLVLEGNDSSVLNIGSGGTLGSAAFVSTSSFEVPLTFSTGLIRTSNTIEVDNTQIIIRLSNLTSNGFIKTINSNGTLSIDTSTYVTTDTTQTISGAKTFTARIRTNELEFFSSPNASGYLSYGNTVGSGTPFDKGVLLNWTTDRAYYGFNTISGSTLTGNRAWIGPWADNTIGIGVGGYAGLRMNGSSEVFTFGQDTYFTASFTNRGRVTVLGGVTYGNVRRETMILRRATESGTTGTPNIMEITNSAASSILWKFDWNGNLSCDTVGLGLKFREGTDAVMGTATLVAGTITVSTTKVTANSRIFLTGQNSSGTIGEIYVSARTAGTSFDITSTSNTDTRLVAWVIVEPS